MNSFSGKTLVKTPQGSVPLSEIEIGDLVLAYDEKSGTTDYYPVTAVWTKLEDTVMGITLDDELIEATPFHPFYTYEFGWLEAQELELGMLIQKADGSYGQVQSAQTVHQTVWVYNLTVDDVDNFFVGFGQWLVHNVHNAHKGRQPWQITKKGTDKIAHHSKFGHFYRHQSTGLWWSKDQAGHGGSVWKVFEETSRGLMHYHDADIYGDFIIGKHKGPVGNFIAWRELSIIFGR